MRAFMYLAQTYHEYFKRTNQNLYGSKKEYLESKEQEVVDVMMTLFDDDQIMKSYINDVREEAREEAEKEAKESARKMIQDNELSQNMYLLCL